MLAPLCLSLPTIPLGRCFRVGPTLRDVYTTHTQTHIYKSDVFWTTTQSSVNTPHSRYVFCLLQTHYYRHTVNVTVREAAIHHLQRT